MGLETSLTAHSGFETQRRHHQKSETGVSVAPKMDITLTISLSRHNVTYNSYDNNLRRPGYRTARIRVKQECIPVGCVLPAAVAITGGLHTPRAGPPARSPSTSPLGVGLDQISLNFPLGCWPGPDPPQLPPWLWAWPRSP